MSAVLAALCKYFKLYLREMKHHSAFHTKKYRILFILRSFPSPTEIKLRFSKLIPAILAPSYVFLILQSSVFVPLALKCLSYQPSLLIKTQSPLQKVLWGSQQMGKYCAIFLNLVQLIPAFNLKIPLPTAKWLRLTVFTVFSARKIDWLMKNQGPVALAIIWAQAPKTVWWTILTCCLQHVPAIPVLLRAQKDKKKNKQTNNKKSRNPANLPHDQPDPPSLMLNLGILSRGTKTLSHQKCTLYLTEIKPWLEKHPFKLTSHLDFYIVSVQWTNSLGNEN